MVLHGLVNLLVANAALATSEAVKPEGASSPLVTKVGN